jgi:hypothetical protein
MLPNGICFICREDSVKKAKPAVEVHRGPKRSTLRSEGSGLIAPIRRSGHHLRLHLSRSNGGGRSVTGRTIRGVLDWPIVDDLRGRSGRQRSRWSHGSARSADHGFSRRQVTKASAVGAAGRSTTPRRHTGERHHPAASRTAAAVSTVSATRSERAAAVAEDRAAAHRTEGVVLADAELGAAAAATAAFGE